MEGLVSSDAAAVDDEEEDVTGPAAAPPNEETRALEACEGGFEARDARRLCSSRISLSISFAQKSPAK